MLKNAIWGMVVTVGLLGAGGEISMPGVDPTRNHVYPDQGIPLEWDLTSGKNIKWKVPLGSQTYAGPIASKGVVLVGTNNDRKGSDEGDFGVLLAFNEQDGKPLWRLRFPKLEPTQHHDWPKVGLCSTPVVVDSEILLLTNQARLVSLALATGTAHWELDLYKDFNVRPCYAVASSPLLVDSKIYLNSGHGRDSQGKLAFPGAPSFFAVQRGGGAVIWQHNGPGERILDGQWSSPASDGKQIVFAGGDGVVYGFDPGGEPRWTFDCNAHLSNVKYSLVAMPTFVDGVVYIAVGTNPELGSAPGRLFAIEAGLKGDVTQKALKWAFTDIGTSLSSVVVDGDLLYAVDFSGLVYCLDRKSGHLVWQYDSFSAFWGSPILVGQTLYLGNEDGMVLVLRAGRQQQLLAEIDMMAAIYSTPFVHNRTMYISTQTQLVAIATPP